MICKIEKIIYYDMLNSELHNKIENETPRLDSLPIIKLPSIYGDSHENKQNNEGSKTMNNNDSTVNEILKNKNSQENSLEMEFKIPLIPKQRKRKLSSQNNSKDDLVMIHNNITTTLTKEIAELNRLHYN